MRKISILLVLLTNFLSYAVKCEVIEGLSNAKANNKKYNFKFDDITRKKIAKIDYIFEEVLKTSHQLVPKYVNSIVIFDFSEEETIKALNTIRIAIMANDINKNLKIYYDGVEKVKELALEIGINEKNIIAFKNEKEVVEQILKDKGNKNDLLSKRILLLTKSSNMRIGYAKYINALDKNVDDIIFDNYSHLDMTREQLEHPSKEEIKKAYKQIECNK